MKINIKRTFLINKFFLAAFVLAIAIIQFAGFTSSVSAYTCQGQTSGGASYYFKDGRCYEPYYKTDTYQATSHTADAQLRVGTTCPANSFYSKIDLNGGSNFKDYCVPVTCDNGGKQIASNSNTCQNLTRDASKDKPAGTAPVRADGSSIPNDSNEWTCNESTTKVNGSNTDVFYNKQLGKCGFINGSGNFAEEGSRVLTGTDPAQAKIDAQKAEAQKHTDCNARGAKWKSAISANDIGSCIDTPATCATVHGVFTPSATDKNVGTCAIPTTPANSINSCGKNVACGSCGEAQTNLIDCGSCKAGIDCLGGVLKIVLFVLTIVLGIVAVGGIVYGSILYASAEDNSGQTSKAKGIIRDVIIGLFLYGFMIAIINWLVPGGVIGN